MTGPGALRRATGLAEQAEGFLDASRPDMAAACGKAGLLFMDIAAFSLELEQAAGVLPRAIDTHWEVTRHDNHDL